MVKLKGILLFFAAMWDCIVVSYDFWYLPDANQVAPKMPAHIFKRPRASPKRPGARTPEAHFQIKSVKNSWVWTIFHVQM